MKELKYFLYTKIFTIEPRGCLFVESSNFYNNLKSNKIILMFVKVLVNYKLILWNKESKSMLKGHVKLI